VRPDDFAKMGVVEGRYQAPEQEEVPEAEPVKEQS
jgi:hypothetical protein